MRNLFRTIRATIATLDRYAGLDADTAEIRIRRHRDRLSVEYTAAVYSDGDLWAEGHARADEFAALESLVDVLDEVVAERDARAAAKAAEREAEDGEQIGPFPAPPPPRDTTPAPMPYECAGGAS